MANLYAKCPACGRILEVAHLPMEMGRAATLAKLARCPCGSAKKLVLPNGADIKLMDLRTKLSSIHAAKALLDQNAEAVLAEILRLRRETYQRESEVLK